MGLNSGLEMFQVWACLIHRPAHESTGCLVVGESSPQLNLKFNFLQKVTKIMSLVFILNQHKNINF